MKLENNSNWSKEEFTTYVLLYCANADFSESADEKQILESKLNPDTLKSIHQEFEGDNDYQKIQKIRNYVEKNHPSNDDIEHLFDEMKAIFEADGKFDILEQNLFRGLKKMLI